MVDVAQSIRWSGAEHRGEIAIEEWLPIKVVVEKIEYGAARPANRRDIERSLRLALGAGLAGLKTGALGELLHLDAQADRADRKALEKIERVRQSRRRLVDDERDASLPVKRNGSRPVQVGANESHLG